VGEPARDLWHYGQARGALDAAGRLINTELAERRNRILFKPAEGNTYGTVRTIVATYQMIMPGEWARVQTMSRTRFQKGRHGW
jgi:gentisate 1,2-dioxygenase